MAKWVFEWFNSLAWTWSPVWPIRTPSTLYASLPLFRIKNPDRIEKKIGANLNPLRLKRKVAPPLLLIWPLIGCCCDPRRMRQNKWSPPNPHPPSSSSSLIRVKGLFRTMTARDELTEEKPRVKLLSSGLGMDKTRPHHGSGFRSKGFAITDLLGLESDLQARHQQHRVTEGGGTVSSSGSGPGPELQMAAGGGLGGFSFPAAGSLPLGLGFLCSLAAQQSPGAACFLPGHLSGHLPSHLLQSQRESHFLQNLEAHRDQYSGTTDFFFFFFLFCFCKDRTYIILNVF